MLSHFPMAVHPVVYTILLLPEKVDPVHIPPLSIRIFQGRFP